VCLISVAVDLVLFQWSSPLLFPVVLVHKTKSGEGVLRQPEAETLFQLSLLNNGVVVRCSTRYTQKTMDIILYVYK